MSGWPLAMLARSVSIRTTCPKPSLLQQVRQEPGGRAGLGHCFPGAPPGRTPGPSSWQHSADRAGRPPLSPAGSCCGFCRELPPPLCSSLLPLPPMLPVRSPPPAGPWRRAHPPQPPEMGNPAIHSCSLRRTAAQCGCLAGLLPFQAVLLVLLNRSVQVSLGHSCLLVLLGPLRQSSWPGPPVCRALGSPSRGHAAAPGPSHPGTLASLRSTPRARFAPSTQPPSPSWRTSL